MARPKPIGFDNFRTFSFVSNDSSGFTFFRKASFSVVESASHRLYTGPSISTLTVTSSVASVTTPEPHGFHVGQSVRLHGLPLALAALNIELSVVAITSTTIFTVAAAGIANMTVAGVGMAGVDIEAGIPVATYAIIPGELCIADHPEAWETPLVG